MTGNKGFMLVLLIFSLACEPNAHTSLCPCLCRDQYRTRWFLVNITATVL
jgi:hypothetical protein